MGEEHPSRFEEQFPLDDIEQAVRDAPSPVALSHDVAEQVGCAQQTARAKLHELHDQERVEKRETPKVTLWWVPDDEDEDEEIVTDGGVHHEVREPENDRMRKRLEHLRTITESTVEVAYHGGGVFMLTAHDDKFWNSVYQTLREHNFQVQKSLGGTVFVEKGPAPRERQREEA